MITLMFAGNVIDYCENEGIGTINTITEDKKTQVEAKLSSYSPRTRKRKLRSKIALLRQKNKNLEKRLQVSKTKDSLIHLKNGYHLVTNIFHYKQQFLQRLKQNFINKQKKVKSLV